MEVIKTAVEMTAEEKAQFEAYKAEVRPTAEDMKDIIGHLNKIQGNDNSDRL